MKKVLIISYHFSDKTAVGAVRINGLAKYLPNFGWMPTILTAGSRSIPDGRLNVLEAPCEDAIIRWKRLLGLKPDKFVKDKFHLKTYKNKDTSFDISIKLWEELIAYPDTVSSWRKPAVALGNNFLKNESFDAIISSSGPPTSNLIARDLKEKNDLPWVADFRDLWTQSHYYRYSRVRQFFERRLEVKTLALADAITTVSKPLAHNLMHLHRGSEVYTIPNGFDPSQKNPGIPQADQFTITYTGNIFRGRQDPEPLFQAIHDLRESGILNLKDISVEFYGNDEGWLARDVRKYDLEGVIKINGLVSREASIDAQRRSHLLLLLTWNDAQEKGICTGKVFDYLAAQRPILSIGCIGGIVEQLLKETNSGIHCTNIENIKCVIMNAYTEFQRHNNVSYYGESSKIDQYSHIEMARKFSKILDKLVVN